MDRDAAAKKLGDALDAAVKMPVKRGEDLIAAIQKTYEEMTEINLLTNDAVMRHDEALALLDEQAEAARMAAAAATRQ